MEVLFIEMLFFGEIKETLVYHILYKFTKKRNHEKTVLLHVSLVNRSFFVFATSWLRINDAHSWVVKDQQLSNIERNLQRSDWIRVSFISSIGHICRVFLCDPIDLGIHEQAFTCTTHCNHVRSCFLGTCQ